MKLFLKRQRMISLHDHDDNERLADKFNDYFANVGRVAFEKSQQNLNTADAREALQNNNVTGENSNYSFRPQPVDVDTVILTVKDLNDTNSYGSDGISLRFIRDSLPIIAFF